MTEMQKKIIEVFEKFVIDLKSVAENPAYAALSESDRDALFLVKITELTNETQIKLGVIPKGM